MRDIDTLISENAGASKGSTGMYGESAISRDLENHSLLDTTCHEKEAGHWSCWSRDNV